ncbi:MAG TPA: extensin family protein [Polyangiales bacterium]|nr:extensin family protein [Polyangiales bacterium]
MRELSTERTTNRPSDVLRVLLVVFAIVGLAYALDIRPRAGDELPSGAGVQEGRDTSVLAATEAEIRPMRLPQTAAACEASLKQAGIDYRKVSTAAADGIAWPIRLVGPIAGVRIEGGQKLEAETNYLDCRLAATLLVWAPSLRARGIVGIDHFSMYRPQAHVDGGEKLSGHAAGRAIDLGRLELQDWRTLNVMDAWKNRKAGADPCGSYRDDAAGELLRDVVCDAAQRGLFQVVVTPHHNAAHADHVHLEIDPQASSLWIR